MYVSSTYQDRPAFPRRLAGRLAQQTIDQAHRAGVIFAQGVAERAWGRALAAQDPYEWPEAESHLAAALGHFEVGEARLEATRGRAVWAQLLRDRGDLVAAREHLEKAAAQFEASGLAEELERTRTLLRDLA
ncbi:MAG TPA: hypothetical protein VHL09_04160 [Dehalococcoidia bacterium]|nr:hypothetical protein [Dehalococcoidia bacterium]